MHVMHAHAYGCRVSSHVGVEVCGQQRDGGGGGGAFFASVVVRQRGPKCHTPCFLHAVTPQSAMHKVLATNPHTLPHHALQTLHTPHTCAITRKGDGGLVAGSATTMRHRFSRQTHAHNFRGVVCIHIQSPKHLESTVVSFPHHQA